MRLSNAKGKAAAQLRRIVSGRVNDAVKLLFADPEDPAALDGLDLSMVSEVKRLPNGTVEVKFIDRLRAIELLMSEELETAAPDRTGELYSAIRKAAETLGERSARNDP